MPATNKALIPNKDEPNSQDFNVNNSETKFIITDITRSIINKIQINKKDINRIMFKPIQFNKIVSKINKEFKLTSLFISNKKSKS